MNQNTVTNRFFYIWMPAIIHQIGLIAASMVSAFIFIFMYFSKNPEQAEQALVDRSVMEKVLEEVLKIANENVVITTGIACLCLLPIFIYMFRKDEAKRKAAGVVYSKKAPVFMYVSLLLFCLCSHYVLQNIINLSEITTKVESYEAVQKTLYAKGIGVQILVLGILNPICEELIYRGLIFRRERESGGFLQAGIFSSLIFSVVHGNMVQMIYAFVVGILLAYLYEKFGSVWAPIAGHIIMNMTSVLLTYFKFYQVIYQNITFVMISTVLVAGGAAIIFLWIRNIEEQQETIVKNEE